MGRGHLPQGLLSLNVTDSYGYGFLWLRILMLIQTRCSEICCFFQLMGVSFSLFLSALGLHRCSDFSPVAARGGYCLVRVCGLLIPVASLLAELGLWEHWLQ